MATRGIIGIKTGVGTWRGRYAHWDNYPSRIVPLLGHLVDRDGLDKVAETIIDKHASWSTIDPFGDQKSGFAQQNYEPGYGWFHQDDDPMELYTDETGYYSWAEFVYVMDPDGVTVFEVTSDRIEGDSDDTTERLEFAERFTWAEAWIASNLQTTE